MKKFLLPLALAVLATVNTESCDPSSMALAQEGLDKMNEIMTGGTSYEFSNSTLVIRDNADLISDTKEAAIVNKLTPYMEQVEIDILLMTTKESGLSSMSPGSTYAQMYLPKDSENWICITYDQLRESSHLYYDGNIAIRAVGAHSDAIFAEGRPYLRDDDYAGSLEAMALKILKNATSQNGSRKNLP